MFAIVPPWSSDFNINCFVRFSRLCRPIVRHGFQFRHDTGRKPKRAN